MMNYNNIILSSAVILQIVCSLKIMLHSDFASRSHIKAILEIATELQTRRHEIIYAAIEDNNRFLKGYKNITFVSLGLNNILMEFFQKPRDIFGSKKELNSLVTFTRRFSEIIPLSYKHTYPLLEKAIRSEHPDVIICDFFSPSCRDVAEMNGIPLISGFQSTDGLNINDANFLTHENRYGPITTNNITFFERFKDAIFAPLQTAYYYRTLISSVNQVRAQFGVPYSKHPFGDFSRTLGLANTFVGFEPAVATPPYLKKIGPIISSFVTPLTRELKLFLNQYKRTLYIAFGSNSALESHDISNIVLSCFKALEQGLLDGVIWGLGKTKRTNFPDFFNYKEKVISSNALFSNQQFRFLDWAPQEAILNHTSTLLFLSHCGLESVFEAIISKKPILCMAFFGDQPRNAKKVELASIGAYINRFTMKPSTMVDKMKNLLNDPAMTINLQRMYLIAKLNSRVEYAADLIETYANNAKQCRPHHPFIYGQPGCEAAHLIPVSYSMNFIKANQLDVYSFAVVVVISIFSFFVYLALCLAKNLSVFGNNKFKKE